MISTTATIVVAALFLLGLAYDLGGEFLYLSNIADDVKRYGGVRRSQYTRSYYRRGADGHAEKYAEKEMPHGGLV